MRDSVSGFLSFSPLQVAKGSKSESDSGAVADAQAHRSSLEYGDRRINHLSPLQFKLCARFQMKPEGVTVTEDGHVLIVFDEDLDRKAGQESFGEGEESLARHFPLLNHQDYVFQSLASELLKNCQ